MSTPHQQADNPTERLFSALREHGCEPKRTGTGWTCRCPAHDDREPSLSIGTGDDGRALVICHAGCSVEAVCGAVGLRVADLFPDDPSRNNGHHTTRHRVPVTNTPRNGIAKGGSGDGDGGDTRKRYPTASEAVAKLERGLGNREGLWTYRNAAGEPVFVVVRFATTPDPDNPESKPGKTFRPVSRVADGWIIGDPPGLIPLYHLPELLEASLETPVVVCEGEKAAEAARVCGLLATTSAHGCKSADKSDWSPVRGRVVWVSLDHDDAGERYAENVSRLALAAGARSVRIIRLADHWPELPKGGDMVDALELAAGDADAVRGVVEALAKRAEPVSFPVTPLTCDPTGNDFVVVSIADLGPAEEPDWLWPGYLAGGAISLLTGLWKGGKTTLLAYLLRDLFTGGGLVETVIDSPVLLVSEESPGLWSGRRDKHTLDPRILLYQRESFARPTMTEWYRLVSNIVELVKERGIGLVIIDTLAGTWPVANENDAGEVMEALAPLRDVSEAGASVLLVHHPRKGEGNHFTAARGSGALSGFPDILIELGREASDANSSTRRVLKAVGRFENIPPETIIDLQDDGYVVLGERPTVKRGDDLDTIGDLLHANGNYAVWEDVRDRWPASPRIGERRLRGLLNQGANEGRWQRLGMGVRNDPYRYRVNTTETDSFPVGPDTQGETGNEMPDDGWGEV